MPVTFLNPKTPSFRPHLKRIYTKVQETWEELLQNVVQKKIRRNVSNPSKSSLLKKKNISFVLLWGYSWLKIQRDIEREKTPVRWWLY
jgi:hypothetical protein